VRFGVTMEVDTEAERNAPAVQKFAAALADILDQDYGPDLLNFTIGIICMRSRPGYEEWYQPRKPSFRTRMRVRLLDGTSTEFANAFGYDVRLTDDEYECFVSANCFGAVELISAKLIGSLGALDQLPPKVKAFDRPRFRADFERGSQVALTRI
jgi:hypothetical protein